MSNFWTRPTVTLPKAFCVAPRTEPRPARPLDIWNIIFDNFMRTGQEQLDTPAPPIMVKDVLTYVGMPAAQIALTLGVTRQTLYNWMKNGEVKGTEDLKRLRSLHKMATILRPLNPEGLVFGSFTRTCRVNDKTFAERLVDYINGNCPDADIVMHFNLLKHQSDHLLKRQQEQREASGGVNPENDIDLISGTIAF